MQRRDFLKGLLSLPIVVFSPMAVARFLSKEEPQLHREDEGETPGQVDLPQPPAGEWLQPVKMESLAKLHEDYLHKLKIRMKNAPVTDSSVLIKGLQILEVDGCKVLRATSYDAVELYLFFWYTRINGERRCVSGQLCYTGPFLMNVKGWQLCRMVRFEMRQRIEEMVKLYKKDKEVV